MTAHAEWCDRTPPELQGRPVRAWSAKGTRRVTRQTKSLPHRRLGRTDWKGIVRRRGAGRGVGSAPAWTWTPPRPPRPRPARAPSRPCLAPPSRPHPRPRPLLPPAGIAFARQRNRKPRPCPAGRQALARTAQRHRLPHWTRPRSTPPAGHGPSLARSCPAAPPLPGSSAQRAGLDAAPFRAGGRVHRRAQDRGYGRGYRDRIAQRHRLWHVRPLPGAEHWPCSRKRERTTPRRWSPAGKATKPSTGKSSAYLVPSKDGTK